MKKRLHKSKKTAMTRGPWLSTSLFRQLTAAELKVCATKTKTAVIDRRYRIGIIPL
jgi:hypothetical protein